MKKLEATFQNGRRRTNFKKSLEIAYIIEFVDKGFKKSQNKRK